MRNLQKFFVLLVFFISSLAFGVVNINTASKAELETLPGVGSKVADEIIAGRPFKSVEDLTEVKGIGDAKFAKLKPLVTIESSRAAARVRADRAEVSDLARGEVININRASKEDLEKLPGIGPQRAEAIIEGRPYRSPEDVMKVKGIKEGIYSKIKDHISVN